MLDPEYAAMKKGMKENGYDKKHPIVILDGEILDGAHRYSCAKATKQKPEFIDFAKLNFTGTPFEYVMQENLRRRNLDPSQAAAIGAEIVGMMKEQEKAEKEAAKQEAKEAAEKAKAAGKKAPKAKPAKKAKGSKARKAAETMGVSERSVAAAEALKEADPVEFAEVKAGKKSLNAATTAAAVKKSAKDRESEAFATATQIIDRVCGDGVSESIKNKLSSKDLVKMSGLDEEEIKRVLPFIESGWKLNAALGFKAISLVPTHPIRSLVDRALAQGGRFELLIEMYGEEWEINTKKRGSVAS
jgi:pyruvate/2-oxoglutarate dehydrogenase complex dihydrolipoamide acyltransferase (E2) component